MSNLNEQSGAFGSYYIKQIYGNLKDMLRHIDNIKKTITEIMFKFNKDCESLISSITTYIDWLNKVIPNKPDINNITNKNNFNDKINKKRKIFFSSILNISFINDIDSIKNSKNKLKELYYEIINLNFNPSDNDNDNLESQDNFQIYFEQSINPCQQKLVQRLEVKNEGEEEGQKTLQNNNSIDNSISEKCCYCKSNYSCCLSSRELYCQNCINIKYCEILDDKKIPTFNVYYFNSKKEIFLYSVEILIKIILLKCNYILNNESKISKNINNNKNFEIKKKFEYPRIKPKDSDLNFIGRINEVLESAFYNDENKDFSEENFIIININELLRESLRKILNDESITSVKNKINKADDYYEYYNNNNNNSLLDFDINDLNQGNFKNENFVKKVDDKKKKKL